ncbi:MAG: hypothetical protein HZC17_08565 [Candidatus Omnitrophica bacterium]|nr:hypothetical protein [Candidatus Omnitrophota bacterium]
MNGSDPKQLKQLWLMRFERMLKLEKDALCFYSDLLTKHKVFLEGTKAKKVLESIMDDEVEHAQYASELVRIVESKKVSDGK